MTGAKKMKNDDDVFNAIVMRGALEPDQNPTRTSAELTNEQAVRACTGADTCVC